MESKGDSLDSIQIRGVIFVYIMHYFHERIKLEYINLEQGKFGLFGMGDAESLYDLPIDSAAPRLRA